MLQKIVLKNKQVKNQSYYFAFERSSQISTDVIHQNCAHDPYLDPVRL